MELSVHCPACGGRTTVEPRDFETPGYVQCPYCQQIIPLRHGAEAEPPESADGSG
jgi:hypothetical protein